MTAGVGIGYHPDRPTPKFPTATARKHQSILSAASGPPLASLPPWPVPFTRHRSSRYHGGKYCLAPFPGENHARILSSQFRSALEFAERQVVVLTERYPDYFPIYTCQGKWHHEGEMWTDWTGGFLTGMMWRFFKLTKRHDWRSRATHYSRLLAPRQHDRAVHDLGFIFLNSYLPWYETAGEPDLLGVLIQAGRTLALRFQEKGQYLASFLGPESLFIDIMMNVPLILFAANQANDRNLRHIGVAHCRTTRDRLVRTDGSTAHEGLFDPATGQFLRQSTQQGLRPDSCWARGLAWSLYGFSKVYELTGMAEFLDIAERNAGYWIEHLPADKVPYWDFAADLSQPLPWGPQKDSSAAAIAASGLLDLADQTRSEDRSAMYFATAMDMLEALAAPEYLAVETPSWEGILKHAVYHTRKNLGVDESVLWGDFFFVEALTQTPPTPAACMMTGSALARIVLACGLAATPSTPLVAVAEKFADSSLGDPGSNTKSGNERAGTNASRPRSGKSPGWWRNIAGLARISRNRRRLWSKRRSWGQAPLALMQLIAQDLQQPVARYRLKFYQQAAALGKVHATKIDPAEVDRLRAGVLTLAQDPNLTHEMIVQQDDPAMKRLEDLIVIRRADVLEPSRDLPAERIKLVAMGAIWEQCATAVWQTLPAGAEKPKEPPTFEKYIQGEEDMAVGLAVPMSDATRKSWQPTPALPSGWSPRRAAACWH